MKRDILGAHQKALALNMDHAKYGTIAEIGAGQEVARWFFRVGGAAGSLAKAISAYDMRFSDAIYGPCERYVSRQRLETMLDHEYELLVERLDVQRGESTCFFAFADTVAAWSFSRREPGHGWMGIRFQTQPKEKPSQIILHARLWNKDNVQDQEAIGILGVNLIHGAIQYHTKPEGLVASLLDNLTKDKVEVDMIEFSGPAFQQVDNRYMSLKLVQNGLTEAAMFLASGEVIQPADALYKKAILVERGSFRPITKTTMDMLTTAHASFVQEPQVAGEEVFPLMEMTLKNLVDGDIIRSRDFLERVDILGALGQNVLISNFGEFYRLAGYLFRYTKKMIGLVMGVPTLQEIFDEKYYSNLDGGILESFGRLFKNDLKLYVYPYLDPQTKALITAGNMRVAPNLRNLYAYLFENRYIEGLRGYDEKCLSIFSRDVLRRIRENDPTWESMVPAKVVEMIKERKLFIDEDLRSVPPQV